MNRFESTESTNQSSQVCDLPRERAKGKGQDYGWPVEEGNKEGTLGAIKNPDTMRMLCPIVHILTLILCRTPITLQPYENVLHRGGICGDL